MFKAFIFSLLLLISNSSFADWEYYGKEGDKTKYSDFKSMIFDKERDVWKLWFLLDFSKVESVTDKIKYQSMVMQREISCVKGSQRQVYAALMSEKMGKGEIVYSIDTPKDWETIIPNRLNDIYSHSFSVLCIDIKKN